MKVLTQEIKDKIRAIAQARLSESFPAFPIDPSDLNHYAKVLEGLYLIGELEVDNG